MDKDSLKSKQNELNSIFEQAQNRLVFQSSDLSFVSIADMVEEGAINITPKYQRRDRWTVKKQSALIESFVLNVPIPPIYLSESEYGRYTVIDGKQRITAIYNFIKKANKISDLDNLKELNDFVYEKLPSSLKNALKIRPFLRIVILLKQSDPKLKYEVFNRLNTGGDNLLPQEIRNAMYEGPLNDLLVTLSELDEFRRHLVRSIESYNKNRVYKEMLDVEYVLRFFTILEYWDEFPTSNMQIAMDMYMREFSEEYLDNRKVEESGQLFKNALDICFLIWGDTLFQRPDGTNQLILGIYDTQMVSIAYYIKMGDRQALIDNKDLIRERFLRVYEEDLEFQDSIRQFTSNPKNIKTRISRSLALIKEAIG